MAARNVARPGFGSFLSSYSSSDKSRYVFSWSVEVHASVTEARRRAAVCHGWLYVSSRPVTFCWDLSRLVTFRPSSATSIKFCQGFLHGRWVVLSPFAHIIMKKVNKQLLDTPSTVRKSENLRFGK